MRAFAEQLISDTAVTCGLSADQVMRKAAKSSVIDPARRIEIEFLPESYSYAPRKLSKALNEAGTHRITRSCTYTARFTARAEVIADDEDWLALFVRNFITAMPRKVADADNNLVTVTAEKAVRGGFERKMVEPFVTRSAALHLTFNWMLCTDLETAMIRSVDVETGVAYVLPPWPRAESGVWDEPMEALWDEPMDELWDELMEGE